MLGFNYKIEKNEDTVLINPNAWIENNSNKIQRYRLSGRDVTTYITKVLDTHIVVNDIEGLINAGDEVLLTRIVSDVCQYRGFLGPDQVTKYFPVPILQVIGIFKDSEKTLGSLDVLFDKIIYKKVECQSNALIQGVEGHSNIGEVVKTGTNRFTDSWEKQPLQVKVGDTILVKDNVSTEIMLNGETYYVVEESGVIGIFDGSVSLNDLRVINNSILLEQYIPEKMSSQSLLWTPNINYEDLDYSEIYCRNQFKVAYLDENLTSLKKDDIVIIDRNVTVYTYFQNQKYFVTNGMSYVEGRRI